jgi:putative alpha-1,2-mannosidase
VNVRVGVSFISVDQARKNLDAEVPDGTTLEETAQKTRTEWAEKLDRVQISGATTEEKQIFYTAFFHTLQVGKPHPLRKAYLVSCSQNHPQYPYEQDEAGKYYSGYDNAVHEGSSYTGYSIWVGLISSVTSRKALAELTSLGRTHIVRNGLGSFSLRPREYPGWFGVCYRISQK